MITNWHKWRSSSDSNAALVALVVASPASAVAAKDFQRHQGQEQQQQQRARGTWHVQPDLAEPVFEGFKLRRDGRHHQVVGIFLGVPVTTIASGIQKPSQ